MKTNSPFRPLHPTLKKCKCGWIGIRSQLYKHLEREHKLVQDAQSFFARHGEVPLNDDDPAILNYLHL